MSKTHIWQRNLPQNYRCLKVYWYLKFWGDLRLMFSRLHGSCCSCDGCWHEVVTSVSSDVLNKLPQTALCNWNTFFLPITSTSTCSKSGTLKLETVHSCKTLELATLIIQCKNQKHNHINEFSFYILCFQQIFPVTYLCFLTSITYSISLLQFQA